MNAGKTALLDLLEEKNEPLDKRLKIAARKFALSDVHVVRNREIILNWLKCELLDGNDSLSERAQDILATMKHCIITVTDILLNPQLADPILETLLQSDQNEAELLQCAKEVMKNEHFLKYFVYHVHKFAEIVSSCVRLAKLGNDDDASKFYDIILKSILYIKDHSFHQDDLKSTFVQSLVEPISTMAFERRGGSNSLPFHEVFHQVLFSDSHFWKTFVGNIFNSGGDGLACDIITTIRNYPTNLKAEILNSAYSLIFQGFLTSNTPWNAKFQVFLALNSFVYMRPVSLGDENPKCVMFNENVQICNKLLELLLHSDVPLETITQSISLTDWMKVLIDVVLNEIKNNFTCAVLRMLRNALSFSPLLLENCLRKFTKNVMLFKKTDPLALREYSELCSYILNVHVKLNRMQKLISALLITVKQSLNQCRREELPDKFDVLPEEIFDQIESAVTNLPSTIQSMTLLNALLYHLENDCIASLERQDTNEVDHNHILLFDIVSYLLSRFINGTRIMDYSVPEKVTEKFISLMDNLGELLARYGKVIISKKHDPDLVECFLRLCIVWGDMQIVFMTYESAPRKISKQVGTTGKAATNLVYLHPYLSDFHWNTIAQRVANFGNENCVRQLNTLVLQKINALPYMEDEIEGPYLEDETADGPAIACALYLANQTDLRWMLDHVSGFAHLLKPFDVLNLSKILVKYCKTCDNDTISQMLSSDVCEMRPLVLAMIHCTFHNLSKTLIKHNSKELKRVLRRLDYVEMVKREMEEDDSAAASLKSKLNEVGVLLSSDFVSAGDAYDANTSLMESDVNILLKLPARYLRDENKSMICLLTVCLIKSLIQLRKDDSLTSVLEELSKFLQSLLTDTRLPDSLDCGKHLICFYCGLKETPYCDSIMQKLCEAQSSYSSTADSIIKIVKALVSGQSPSNSAFIQSRSEGINLVTSYLINFEEARKRKNDDNGLEVVKKVKRMCYENFDSLCDRDDNRSEQLRDDNRSKQLALFTILLDEALQSNDTEHVQQLSSHLAAFIAIVEEKDSPSEEASQFLLTVLRHIRELKLYLPDNFILNTWRCLWFVSKDELLGALLRRASLEEYEEIIHLLIAHTEGSLNEYETSQITILSHHWKLVLGTSMKLKKTLIQRRAVFELGTLAQKHAMMNESAPRDLVNRMFVQIFTAVLQNTEISLRYQTIDLCFDLVSYSVNANPSNELLVDCVELLFVFCLIWRSMLLDRIPAFFLCYKSLFSVIVRKAKNTEKQNMETLCCAIHKLEKLTDNLVKSKKDFTKTAISAVSDLMKDIISVKVESKIMNHVKTIIYCWIGMCDSHGLQHLPARMSQMEKNLLNEYLSEYKFYKFIGKV